MVRDMSVCHHLTFIVSFGFGLALVNFRSRSDLKSQILVLTFCERASQTLYPARHTKFNSDGAITVCDLAEFTFCNQF